VYDQNGVKAELILLYNVFNVA